MSNHSIAVWILSSLSGILVLFVGVATGLNDPAHATHEMGQLFGYIGFAVLIVSSFFAMWAIYIYEPEKIRIDEPTNIAEDKVINSDAFVAFWEDCFDSGAYDRQRMLDATLDIDLPDPEASEDYHDYIDAMGLDDLSPRDRFMKIKLLIRQVSKDIETTDLDNTHDTYLKVADLLYEVDALYRSK